MNHRTVLFPRTRTWARLLLLLLILFAFARLVWRLDANNLWLDEGFSLQRAESPWPDLLRGLLVITDGANSVDTIDQHPFGYFAALGLMLRLAGESEFALRFPSVIAATLLVPACWAFARHLARRGVLPPSAPAWAALLAALNPFYLWFGQEVRMYASVALLAVVSTYFLWCTAEVEGRRQQRRYAIAYGISLIMLISLHYYAVLILPVHAGIVYRRLTPRGRRWGLLAGVGLLAIGASATIPAVWQMLKSPGAGSNFASVSLRVLAPDLVNAFTLGLSVDLARVWPLDVISAAIALLGAAWGLRNRDVIARGGWLLPAFVLIPAALLLIINAVRPAYMTARHMSQISGAYLLLLSGGLAWLWQWRRWLGGAAAAVLFAGMIYSSINYFTLPAYGKGDLAGMGQHLREQMQPGDLLVIDPPYMHRLYRYYLPMDAIERWAGAGQPTGWRALPGLPGDTAEQVEEIATLSRQYRRIWLARSIIDTRVRDWLRGNTFRAQDWNFYSPLSALGLELFVPSSPVLESAPAAIQHPTDAAFADTIGLRGYEVGQAFEPGYAVPVTLYWQALQPPERRYKYILRWVVKGEDGVERILATTEHEPYDGLLPTTAWTPGTTIREFSTILPPAESIPGSAHLTLQMYDAETLRKLPVTAASGVQVGSDSETLILPFRP